MRTNALLESRSKKFAPPALCDSALDYAKAERSQKIATQPPSQVECGARKVTIRWVFKEDHHDSAVFVVGKPAKFVRIRDGRKSSSRPIRQGA